MRVEESTDQEHLSYKDKRAGNEYEQEQEQEQGS